MKKKINILLGAIAYIMLFIIVLPIFISLLLQIDLVQNIIVDTFAKQASQKIHATVSVEHVSLDLFYKAKVKGFYVEDPIDKDTLLYANEVSATLQTLSFKKGLSFKNVTLKGGKLFLNSDSTYTINIKYIVNYLKSDKEKNKDKKFCLNMSKIIVDSLDFEYRRYGSKDVEHGINFQDMRFNDISTRIDGFSLVGDSISMRIDSLSFVEKSGFEVHHVSTTGIVLSPNAIKLKNSYLRFDDSWVSVNGYAMYYDQWNMSDYLNNVVMDVDIDDSKIDLSTISQFTSKKRIWNSEFVFKGNAKGTVSNIEANIIELSTFSTKLENASIVMKGLPDFKNTVFDLYVSSLRSPVSDIPKIIKDFTGGDVNLNAIKPLSVLEYSGTFNGVFSDFESLGKLSTSIGAFNINVNTIPIDSGGYMFKGNVNTAKFGLGKMFNVKSLGDISVNADINAKVSDEELNITTTAVINSLLYNNYIYHDINIDGNLLNKTFSGDIKSDDPNLNFLFNGYIAINNKIPHYDFDMKINNADLHALNFDNRDSLSRISMNLQANGYGANIDNINGVINIDSLRYISSYDTVTSNKIRFVTKNNEEQKYLKMTSEFADIEMRGVQSYSNITHYFKNTIQKYLPSLQVNSLDAIAKKVITGRQIDVTDNIAAADTIEKPIDNYYIVTVDVKQANNVAGIFIPGVKVAQGTKLSFVFNPKINRFSLSFNSDYISKGSSIVSGINIDSRSESDSISMFMRSKELTLSKVYIPNIMVQGSIKNNNINLFSRFANQDDGSNAYIALSSFFSRDSVSGAPRMDVSLLPSYITLFKQKWSTNSCNISLDTTMINIDNFEITSQNQYISLDGVISENTKDTLSIGMSGIDLNPMSNIFSSLGYNINGNISGNIEMSSVLKDPYFISKLSVFDLLLNDHKYPDLMFYSNMSQRENKVLFQLDNSLEERLVEGYVIPSKKQYHAEIEMRNIDLSVINPLMTGIAHATHGTANASLVLSNINNGDMSLNGKVDIPNFGTTIDFTNVAYNVSGRVDVTDNKFILNGGKLVDAVGNEAPFEAYLTHDKFKKVRYMIKALPNKMLCMNTTMKDNDIFYGNIYASGDMTINGTGKNVVMNVNATTENQSTFFMPLSNKSSISQADFIEFVSSDKDTVSHIKKTFLISDKDNNKNSAKGSFEMNMNIDVRPNIEAQIVIDPTMGDVIKARGVGQFLIKANPSKNVFSIYGGYEISSGSYKFTLKNLFLDKNFTIAPGSSISWNGDPLKANLNVTAIYKVKTSLAPLLGSEQGMYNRRVDVDCNLTLNGQLLKPDVKLGVTVPGADPETQGFISSALNTEENVAMQVFWLLFANTFFSDNSGTGSNVNVGLTTGAVTGLEFLSNQISNWISNDKFNLGINYRPKSELTSDEIELNISTNILKNKLFLDVEGNYDFNNNSAYTTEQFNNLSGDFAITYVIDNSGNLRAKAFSRQITTFDENQGLQESGIGVYYKEDFNKFKDLVDKYKNIAEKKRIRIQNKNIMIDSVGRPAYRVYNKNKKKKERDSNKN